MADDTRMRMKVGDGPWTPEFTGADLKRATQKLRRKQGKPPMKQDPTFDEAADNSYRATAEELRQFIERHERLQEEKQEVADQQKLVMAEAKARGYDVPTIRAILKLRKMDPDKRAEKDALLDMYKTTLGMDQ